MVLADILIESYVWDLETGTIEPTLQLPWDPVSGGSFYQLLWEDKILIERCTFLVYVMDDGMSVAEPVDVMIIRKAPLFISGT